MWDTRPGEADERRVAWDERPERALGGTLRPALPHDQQSELLRRHQLLLRCCRRSSPVASVHAQRRACGDSRNARSGDVDSNARHCRLFPLFFERNGEHVFQAARQRPIQPRSRVDSASIQRESSVNPASIRSDFNVDSASAIQRADPDGACSGSLSSVSSSPLSESLPLSSHCRAAASLSLSLSLSSKLALSIARAIAAFNASAARKKCAQSPPSLSVSLSLLSLSLSAFLCSLLSLSVSLERARRLKSCSREAYDGRLNPRGGHAVHRDLRRCIGKDEEEEARLGGSTRTPCGFLTGTASA